MKYVFWFYFYLPMAGLVLDCCEGAFSSCGEQGLLSGCGAHASHCPVSSRCRPWARGHVERVLWGVWASAQALGCVVRGLSCPAAWGISRARNWTGVSCISRWILNHLTTREIQSVFSCSIVNNISSESLAWTFSIEKWNNSFSFSSKNMVSSLLVISSWW